jgi:predicted  nucleic acid-binding Zn-ribbon protein
LIILAIEDVTVKKNLEAQLAKYTKDLELKVMERTKDLNRKVKELEGINRDMVGRELKMVELKKEIEDLKKQLKKQQ